MIKKLTIASAIFLGLAYTTFAQPRPPHPMRKRLEHQTRRDQQNSANANDEYRQKKEELKALERERAEKKRNDAIAHAATYGSNFIRLTPMKILDIGAVGVGLEYERLFGTNRNFGINIPFSVQFNQEYVFDRITGQDDIQYNPYFYFTPGLKFYPSGQRRVTYAVGPTLLMGVGKEKSWVQDAAGFSRLQELQNFRLGLMVMNYVNFQLTDHFSLGIDAGIGIRYLNRYKDLNSNLITNDAMMPTGQFSINFGYRF